MSSGRGGSGNGGGEYGICFKWRTTGSCPYGCRCKFLHGPRNAGTSGGGGSGNSGSNRGRGSSGSRGQGGVCHQWQNSGFCRFGNSCKFKHVGPGGGGGGGSGSSRRSIRQATSADLCRFVKHLSVLPIHRLGTELIKSSSMWRRCWQEHQSLDDAGHRVMLEVLAKTPGSSTVDPPPIHLLRDVVSGFLDDATKQGNSDECILTSVKTVADVLSRALQFEWLCSRDQVKDGLSDIVIQAESKLKKQHKDHRDVASRLIEVLEDMEKPWRIRLKDVAVVPSSDDAADSKQPVEFGEWQSATVKWLSNREFFVPSSCPKMKVGRSGVYESAEEYMDTVHRLWVAMTFFEGHASLAPHCRSRGQNGSCGSALWPVADLNSHHLASMRCRTKNCPRPVEFSCRVKSHDSLCGPCTSRSVVQHLGGPGPSASTHVYDARVEHVNHDGVVYLTQFECRNPPQRAIHWRSTKRLSPPNLVGLVRLGSKGSALVETDQIKWGEIVFHGDSRNEERRRQNGDLAVNTSSITDLDPDYFEEGAQIAIIDCMTFVPEWVPVLRALGGQKQTRLPFENGRHLNLWKANPVTTSVSETAEIDSISAHNCGSLIENMISSSQLEPIREVRRDPTLRDELTVQLEHLVTATTLDRMQLLSFIDSLLNPVHLTQGPPGTGKSYLGVVLVRALIIIRNLWIRKSRSVGVSPILVLSYKNHAIDEFLVDLVQAEPTLSRNKLIRIGGQCKDTRLQLFSERSAYHTDSEVKTCGAKVDQLIKLKDSIKSMLECKIVSFLSYFQAMFHESDEKTKRQGAYDATNILMECLVRRHLLLETLDEWDGDHQPSPDEVIGNLSFLQLDDNGESSRDVNKLKNQWDGSSFVAHLLDGVSHYEKEHWGDVLLMWLSGKVPLPRCIAGDSSCDDLSVSPDVALCSKHRCSFHSMQNERCSLPCNSSDTSFCSKHICQADQCGRSRVGERQNLCSIHACWRCVELGITSEMVLDPPPRNVCEDHPLCWSPSCIHLCTKDGNFCEKHANPKCSALTKRGKPCKGTVRSPMLPYCPDHMHVAKFPGDEEEEVDLTAFSKPVPPICMPRCKTIKRNGQQCKGACLYGSLHCYDHSPLEAPRTAQNEEKLSSESSPSSSKTDDECSQLQNIESSNAGQLLSHDGIDVLSEPSFADQGKDESSAASSVASVEDTLRALIEFDETELEDEGENLQHLRDIFEVNDGNDSECEDSQSTVYAECDQGPGVHFAGILEDASSTPKEWNWDLTTEERWDACQVMMESLRGLLGKASAIATVAISRARKDLVEAKVCAKAKVYEGKSVIGGTMVGCISRLESIRKTRPFAVVVEEASEVLEPLLFSCLSESTMKLEMIGDHRQLQPSVMSRFDFELCNKVNVSMFQRLIEAPESHRVSTTVLSCQRRMRKNICDLTRNFYADIVEIEDHETCGIQVLGKRNNAVSTNLALMSSTGGREIPGVAPHIFLWTHDGDQQRAKVGVSRINPQEAKMTCALVAYLVECGVPKPSIAVLTPYKGQLMELRNMLFKDQKSGPLKLISRNPQERDAIRLSTIDRFQGDEEDIVICSLVVDEKSRTGFVKLVNRMIVLLSRARLGLYIIGNLGYFENPPKHWADAFKMLQHTAESDSTADAAELQISFMEERTGPKLPLCCPVHRNVTAFAASADDLCRGFCKEPCAQILSCGHLCSLPCHWPQKRHNGRCAVMLESPCDRHPAKITCHKAFASAVSAPPSTDHKQILSFYECSVKVDVVLPCGHFVKRPCSEGRRISAGEIPLPVCDKPSPVPYTFPSCGHTRPVSCSERETYNEKPALVHCEKEEMFEPPCGHVKKMKCFKKSKLLVGAEVFLCDQSVSIILPRCGHNQKLSCRYAQQLGDWTGDACGELGIVEEGVSYGPQDYPCQEMVSLVRTCGHMLSLPCSQAFVRSTSLHPCRELVASQHPSCGHRCHLTCKQAKDLKEQGIQAPPVTAEVVEGQVLTRPGFAGIAACTKPVKLIRKCGHTDVVACSQALKPLKGCQEEIRIRSLLCGHPIRILCHLKRELSRPIWAQNVFSSVSEYQEIPKDAQPSHGINALSVESKRALRSCQEKISVLLDCDHKRSVDCNALLDMYSASNQSGIQCNVPVSVRLSCGHNIEMKCVESKKLRIDESAFQRLQHFVGAPSNTETIKCDALVSVRRKCGHTVDMTCYEHQQLNENELSVQCSGKKRVACWNHAACENQVEVDCGFEGTVACSDLSTWTCAGKKHSYKIKQCSKGRPNACPGCSFDGLNEAIKRVSPFIGEQELRSNFTALPTHCVHWIPARLGDFIQSEREVLMRYRKNMEVDHRNVWERPIFTRDRRVPCYRVLNKKNRGLECFDPKKILKGPQTFHGMMTKMLTRRNLIKLSSTTQSETLTLLVGFVAVAKTKTLAKTESPTNNKGKNAVFRSSFAKGFDSLNYFDEKGFENVVVWDPFPLIALCRLTLTTEQVRDLGEQLNEKFNQDLKPHYVGVQPPPSGCFIAPAVTLKSFDSDSKCDSSIEDDRHEEVAIRLRGTVLDGLRLNLDWSGGIDSDGGLPHVIEKNLFSKMQFVDRKASPFAGIQLLRTLLQETKVELLHLLIAAEMLEHASSEAKASFDTYIQYIRSDPGERDLHPWALIVAARLHKEFATNLLSSFVHFFPLQEKYLSKNELEGLDGLQDIDEPDILDAHSLLLQEWEDLKAAYPGEISSDSTEKLLNLIGLRKVKEEVIRLWKAALQLKRMDDDARKENRMAANYCFLGNPGTGKTTVSRLFAAILFDSGIREKNTIVETTAQHAKDRGNDKFKELVSGAMGGVLFIDEAYDLDPVGDFKGRPIVNELLTLCENKRDDISVILAGYEDDFQKKFYAFNEGLKSRFRELLFEDFDEKELARIWTSKRNEKKWKEEESVCSVAVKRMSKMAGRKGFGNAREVRRHLEAATQAALSRMGDNFSMSNMVLTIGDVIGEDPRLNREKLQDVLKAINEKIGWKRVKQRVVELIDLCSTNYQRELLGKPPFEVFLNRMFLGSPGTGKTTCAMLYGRLLKELGFLSVGDIVSKTASDFVGSAIGESQKKTVQILEGSRGKVLIIDEAYAFNDSNYGKQVLDTLVEKVQGAASDDIAVLLLGYELQMLEMIANQNPGLSRRFPTEHAFYFDDYDENELLQILNLYLQKQEIEATFSFREKALDVLRMQKHQANFGNAGSVELVVKGAMLRASKRSVSVSATILEADDIQYAGASHAEKMEDPLSQLDNLYRMESVKAKLEMMKKDWAVQRREGGDDPELGHFVFLGSPGTGKTTVARVIANILFGLSLKPSDVIVEKPALDLTADFVGQTSTKVNDALKEAKGGVLFIDEAYNLGEGPYGKEACDALVAAMTSEKFRDVLIVIAGYPAEINKMLDANAGLKSRFTNFFEFPDWIPGDCVSFFAMLAAKESYKIGENVLEILGEGCARLKQLKGWGNGRDVTKLWKTAKRQRSERVYDNPELEKTIIAGDLKSAVSLMVQARIGKHSDLPFKSDPLAELDSLFRMETIKEKLERLKKAWAVSRRECNGIPDLGHFVFTGSPGTGKTTVARAIARVLFGLELKPSDKIIETSGLELTGQYIGQTKKKVTDILKEAKGGVLFIDEAYTLGQGSFGQEACDTIVAAMTNEDFQDVQIVIAGYTLDIDEMFRSNSGLKSRFTHFFEFADWTADDCVEFFQACAVKENFAVVEDKLLESVRNGCQKLIDLEGWANGRDVKRIWDEAKSHRAERVYDKPEENKTLTLSDINKAIASILEARRPKTSKSGLQSLLRRQCNRESGAPSATDSRVNNSVIRTDVAKDSKETEKQTEEQAEESPAPEVAGENVDEDGNNNDNDSDSSDVSSVSCCQHREDERDEGVPDEVWNELQEAEAREHQQLKEMNRIKEEQETVRRIKEEEQLRHEAALERIAKILEQEEREQARRKAEEEEAKRKHEAELKCMKLEEEERRIREEIRKREETQRRLRSISPCPMGYKWHRVGSGWRCAGGSHFVSDTQLKRQFGVII